MPWALMPWLLADAMDSHIFVHVFLSVLWDFNVKVLHKCCIDRYSAVISKPVEQCCPNRCHLSVEDLDAAENSLLSLAAAAPLVHFARTRCAP